MSKILFVMFQGAGTNLKSWNEETKSNFLDRLHKLGSVYTYQDKVNNLWHYDKTDSVHIDYDADIDFNLAYVNPETHIRMVYNDLKAKCRDLRQYRLIPVGWSAGCLWALYFAQVYASQCYHVILLDPAVWTPRNMKLRLKDMDVSWLNGKPPTNAILKKMLDGWKTNHTDKENMYRINDLCHYIRSSFFGEHLSLTLPVPTTAFVNVQQPEKDEWSKSFNNKTRLENIRVLKKHNPENYNAFILTNKEHFIFNHIQPAKQIVKYIQQLIS